MAPKKPPITQREHTINSEEEECEPSSAQRPTENVSEIANLRQMLQGFIDSQHQKDEELQREARRQDQRWRSLQHQFGLLQEEVRKGQRGVQQDPEAQHSETPTGQAHSRIYRPVVSAHEREGEHRGAPLMAWPRLPQLKDTDDIEHYFLMFERLALAARWPRADWAFHLVPLLEGKARAAYVAMCADEIHDFNAVKEAILRKFEINPETYRQRFRKDTVLEDETPKELFTRLTGLYERWMRPKGKSKDEIGQTIVLEQFLNMINPELKSWIMERSPGSAAQAIEMADAYVAARQAEGKFRLGKPHSSKQTKRFNQTLKQILRKLANSNGTDWDAWLPFALFAYREVPQASSGFSPFELLYGRQVRGPLDVLKEAWDGENKEEKLNILSYVLKMREKLSQLTETVHVNMEKAQEQQKRWYDKAARKRVLKPRQKVLILLPTSDTGLLAKWQGPYEVHRQVGETTYELHLPERKKKFQSFHINMLRPWNEPDTTSAEQLWIRAVEEDEEVKEQYFPTGGGCEVLPEVSHLNAQQQKELLRVIPLNLFSEKPGRTAVTQHSIRLSKDEPIRQTTCRVPARLVPELKNEVEEMLKMGIIEPSDSEWCSPVVLVPKKDGGLRFCVDFSKLNAVSAFDPYPMPRADELIERLGKAKVLSTLDLCKGYWQVPLSQSSRKLTAFRTPSGLYHFLTMPFGLHGSAATFQRLMDKVLRGTEGFAAAYIDDVVIYSSSWEEHLRHLSIVMRKITEAGLTANPSKCHLALGEVSYLGYILGGGQIRPQVDKVEAVKATPQPSTKRRVRSFLGLVGWYRRFIPNFATKATALTDLTKNDQPQRVKWTENCEHSFNELKNALCEEPVLASPDFSKPFIVQTDASGSGLGAVLLQGEGEDRKPILYISRKLFPREVKYSTIEKEALAIKWALDSLKYYLLGNDFVLETDHRALQWIRRMKDSNARITRWYLSLQPYRFDIVYRKGSQNVIADYLSRHWEGVELEGGGV
ncbi:hypothetical protein NFI96_028253 [Prochilodus magdalenae]|nr:hypothetical protein NFI96_028253 [Prochilodus magdalenae]